MTDLFNDNLIDNYKSRRRAQRQLNIERTRKVAARKAPEAMTQQLHYAGETFTMTDTGYQITLTHDASGAFEYLAQGRNQKLRPVMDQLLKTAAVLHQWKQQKEAN